MGKCRRRKRCLRGIARMCPGRRETGVMYVSEPKKEPRINKGRAVANNVFAVRLLWKICPSIVVHKAISRFLGYFEWLFFSAFFMRYVIRSLERGDSFRTIMVFVVIVVVVEASMSLYDKELENKAETVLIISKNLQNNNISEVKPMHMRDKEFTTFAFHIDDDRLPVLDSSMSVTVVKPREKSLVSLDNEVHKEILCRLFEEHAPSKYSELVELVSQSYEAAGYKRGMNGIKNLLKLLTSKGIIVRDGDVYAYKPERFINPSPTLEN